GSLFAQDAVLSCAITDPSGGPVASSRLEAIHLATGVSTQAISNAAGLAVFPALPPGLYQLTAEKPGFARLRYENITLEVGARLPLRLSLPLGAITETITVNAGADNLLASAAANVGGLLAGQQVLDLPIPARNALSLTYTQAGLIGDNFAGARRAALNITLDG